MEQYILPKDVIKQYDTSSWQQVVYSEFESALLSKTRPFPCVFGVSGLKAGQIRIAFPDPLTPKSLAPILKDYVQNARGFGPMTSLVVFTRPGPVQHIESYQKYFWSLLNDLEGMDQSPRPEHIPEQLDDPKWEFCFAGEPIFVVCNTPSHVLRQSRRSTSFMITFQPRWVFEGILDADADPIVARSLETVRSRLKAYDAISTYPYLGKYGEIDTREYQQYFIADSNDAPACPFHKLGNDKTSKGEVA